MVIGAAGNCPSSLLSKHHSRETSIWLLSLRRHFSALFTTDNNLNAFDNYFCDLIDCLKEEDLEAVLRGSIRGNFETISSGVFAVKPGPDPGDREFDFGSPYVYTLLAGRF